MNIYEELSRIQQILKAPKGQYNKFGSYYYRSCEDILEAIKLITNCSIIISDEIVLIGDRFYIKATARIVADDGVSLESFGYARESFEKKGMDASQITGAASSYARKYALNGLFAIDDTRDSDSSNDKPKVEDKKTPQQKKDNEKQWYNDFDKHKKLMESEIKSGKKTVDQIIKKLKENYKISTGVIEQIKLLGM